MKKHHRNHIVLTLAPCTLVALLSAGCKEEQSEVEQAEQCSVEAMYAADVLASKRFNRQAGKPVVEELEFSTDPGDDVCLIVVTGAPDAHGIQTESAPASLSVVLDDSQEAAGPSDFNAHSQFVARHIPADGLDEGLHSLAVELRGKPGSVADVAVLRLNPDALTDASSPAFSPIQNDRLEDPAADLTFMIDESIVTFAGDADGESVADQLEELPFPAIPVGTLGTPPIYQLYLPGAFDEDELLERINAIQALPGVESAIRHYVGGAVPFFHLPQPPNDHDYINPQDGTLTPAAWPLEQIRAPDAWTPQNVHSDARAGVLDFGFRIEHPELMPGIFGLATADGRITWDPGDPATVAAASERMAPVTGSAACEFGTAEECAYWSKCKGDGGSSPVDHGTTMAAILGATGNNTTEGLANITGVSWGANMFLGIPLSGDSDVERYSSFATQQVVRQMAAAGVDVISISYGLSRFCSRPDEDGNKAPISDEYGDFALMEKRINEEKDTWSDLVASTDILFVAAGGNNGDLCQKTGVDSKWCSTWANGTVCSLSASDPAAKQVLCIAASGAEIPLADPESPEDGFKEGALMDGTHHGGDLLAAPGVDVYVINAEGDGLFDFPISGSSAAAPMVAGAAVHMLGINQDLSIPFVHDTLLAGGTLQTKKNLETYRILDLDAATDTAHRCRTDNVLGDGCTDFPDVGLDNQYYDAIRRLSCNCILKGDEQQGGLFLPGKTINRAEALKIVLKAAYPTVDFSFPGGDGPLADVPADAWYAGYVDVALTLTIIEEGEFLVEGGLLNPKAPVSRGDFVRLLTRASADSDVRHFIYLAQALGLPATNQYPDVPQGSPYYKPVSAATKQCLISGYENNKFGPSDDLTREQAAKVTCLAMYGRESEQCGFDWNNWCIPPYKDSTL